MLLSCNMHLTSPHSRHTRLVVVVSWAWAIDVSSRVKEEPAKDRAPHQSTDRPNHNVTVGRVACNTINLPSPAAVMHSRLFLNNNNLKSCCFTLRRCRCCAYSATLCRVSCLVPLYCTCDVLLSFTSSSSLSGSRSSTVDNPSHPLTPA